jgi:hypothetical protein
MLGFALGMLLMTAVAWMFFRTRPNKVDRWFRRFQLVSAALYSLGHGGNDAQKTMGIIAMLLFAAGLSGPTFHVPFWVVLICQAAMAFGTLFGGWRIVKTMGQKITKLKPVGGFCAETGGAITLFLATGLGIPVSTTHTITGAIIGVGATHKLSAGALGGGTEHRVGMDIDDPVRRRSFRRLRGGSPTGCSEWSARPTVSNGALRTTDERYDAARADCRADRFCLPGHRQDACLAARPHGGKPFVHDVTRIGAAGHGRLHVCGALPDVRALARDTPELSFPAHAARQRRYRD